MDNGFIPKFSLGAVILIIMVIQAVTINHIIANDKRYSLRYEDVKINVAENKVHLLRIKEDLDEIKTILRRTAPFERKYD